MAVKREKEFHETQICAVVVKISVKQMDVDELLP